jgi:hypothetical protein
MVGKSKLLMNLLSMVFGKAAFVTAAVAVFILYRENSWENSVGPLRPLRAGSSP